MWKSITRLLGILLWPLIGSVVKCLGGLLRGYQREGNWLTGSHGQKDLDTSSQHHSTAELIRTLKSPNFKTVRSVK